KQVVLHLVGLGLEALVKGRRLHASQLFLLGERFYPVRDRMWAAVLALREHPQTSAVRGNFFDVEYGQPVSFEDNAYRTQGQVGKVLVIDGVELVFPYQVQQVWELEGGHTFRFEQRRKAGDEIVDVRHVRQHVVRDHQVSSLGLR